jgi:hypothetical protein
MPIAGKAFVLEFFSIVIANASVMGNWKRRIPFLEVTAVGYSGRSPPVLKARPSAARHWGDVKRTARERLSGN